MTLIISKPSFYNQQNMLIVSVYFSLSANLKTLLLLFLEARHPGPNQSTSRAEQEDRRASSSTFCNMRPVWPPQPSGNTAEGSHVQEQAQAWFISSLNGSTVSSEKTFRYHVLTLCWLSSALLNILFYLNPRKKHFLVPENNYLPVTEQKLIASRGYGSNWLDSLFATYSIPTIRIWKYLQLNLSL